MLGSLMRLSVVGYALSLLVSAYLLLDLRTFREAITSGPWSTAWCSPSPHPSGPRRPV